MKTAKMVNEFTVRIINNKTLNFATLKEVQAEFDGAERFALGLYRVTLSAESIKQMMAQDFAVVGNLHISAGL